MPYGAAYRFDADSTLWTTLREMPQPAHHIMSAVHNGKIYIFGGFTLGAQSKMSWQPTNGSWVMTPATDSYKPLAPLPRLRGAGYAVTVGDKIYVIGGGASNADASSFNPIPLATADGRYASVLLMSTIQRRTAGGSGLPCRRHAITFLRHSWTARFMR